MPRLLEAYTALEPDVRTTQRVAFGTSGHRGTSFERSFNEWHVLAITQAICEYRAQQGSMVRCSSASTRTPVGACVRECAGGTGGQRRRDADRRGRRIHADAGSLACHPGLQPRPQRGPRRRHRGDTIAQSAERWRFQVQPPQRRAGRHRRHQLDRGAGQRTAEAGLAACGACLRAGAARRHHPRARFIAPMSPISGRVLDFEVDARAGIRMGVDPLGGAGVHYWARIAERSGRSRGGQRAGGSDIRLHDTGLGRRIRMDPSSAYAMQRLLGAKDRYRYCLRLRHRS